jgi:hypothetical protein
MTLVAVSSATRNAVLYADFAYGHYDLSLQYAEGSNPRLALAFRDKIMSELDSLDSLWVSTFLFNNPFFHDIFNMVGKVIGKSNIIVSTIPPTGYKRNTFSRARTVHGYVDHMRSTRWKSKTEAVEELLAAERHYTLRFVPHFSCWVPDKLEGITKAEDAMQFFSNHEKVVCGMRTDGTSFVINCSFNFDILADPQSNTMFVCDLSHEETFEMVRSLSEHMRYLSVSSECYGSMLAREETTKRWMDTADTLPSIHAAKENSIVGFTSPLVPGSGDALCDKFYRMAAKSTGDVVIAAQHVMGYAPKSGHKGLADIVSLMHDEGRRLRIFSQTFLDPRNVENAAYYRNGMPPSYLQVREPSVKDALRALLDASIECGADTDGTFDYTFNANWHGRMMVTNQAFVSFSNNPSRSGFFNGQRYFWRDESGRMWAGEQRRPNTVASCRFGEIGHSIVLEDEKFATEVLTRVVPEMTRVPSFCPMGSSTPHSDKQH